jgi:hypothetical protein
VADEKKTKLSIVIRAVDQATAKIAAINAKIESAPMPKAIAGLKKALSGLRENSGIDGVIAGFRGVGDAVSGVLAKVGLLGGLIGAAAAGMLKLVGDFDDLGDKAESIGVSVDFLAQMRYAAERSGASVESLDSGLQGFSKSLGQARGGAGRMAAFLGKVSPALLVQLKAAKSNEAAFDLLASAMGKLADPAKRAALAQSALGDAALGPLFAKGPKAIKELRDRYAELAPGQAAAAEGAGKADDALKDLKASTDGVKAALVTGLAPAMTVIIERLTKWFTSNRAAIAEWAASIGERIPGAVRNVVEWVGKAYDTVSAFIERVGGLKTIAVAAGAVIAGPLLLAITSLVGALVTAGSAMSGLIAKTGQLAASGSKIGGALGTIGTVAAPLLAAKVVNDLTGGSIQEQARARGFQGGDFDFAGMARFLEKQQSGSDISAQINAFKSAAATSAQQQNAKITIDIANAPRGTRVNADPQNTATVDTSVGYQLLGAQ